MNMCDALASSYGPQNSPRANSPCARALGAHVHTLGVERVEGLADGGGVVKGTICQKSMSYEEEDTCTPCKEEDTL
jgi:hypothetical protein